MNCSSSKGLITLRGDLGRIGDWSDLKLILVDKFGSHVSVLECTGHNY